MKQKLNKYLVSVMIVGLLMSSFAPYYQPNSVYAADQPSQPDSPDQPSQPDSPDQPSQPDSPNQPTQPGQNDGQAPTVSPSPTPTIQPSLNQDESGETTANSTESNEVTTGGTTDQDNMGETTIETGDANAIGVIENNANTNVASGGQIAGSGDSTLVNSGNGSSSDNDVDHDNNTSTNLIQDNSVAIKNTADLASDSGGNTAKNNTGGDVTIETGDANTALTVVNQANTNVAADSVVEFNIIDDHVGDIVLDFDNPCFDQACEAGSPMYLANLDNGSNSDNTITSSNTLTDNTFQTNDATVENLIILEADSGGNTAKDNTNGDVTIKTGDANVSANVTNFVNNNIAGDIVVGVVNIFGELVGDLIFSEPEPSDNSGAYVANLGNGS